MRRVVLVITAALGVLLVASCTSFTFRPTGKGSAPGALQDRSGMVGIPAGVLEMGAQNAEPDEYPPHKVELRSFVIDKTEVTVHDYEACVVARVCRSAALNEEARAVLTPQHPISGVSWYDAVKYCEWVGKRLPTEAEWEQAARAPRAGKYPWDGPFDASRVNVRGDGDGYPRTAPVGSFPTGASGYGALDLAGNVAEWTADWYEATWYQKSPGVNPKGPEASTGSRAVRGGSWADTDYMARATVRLGIDPNLSNDSIGFRCAADR